VNENDQPPKGSGIPTGIVWAAVLLGVAALIGSVAMLVWVVNTTRPAAVTDPSGDVVMVPAEPTGAGAAATIGLSPTAGLGPMRTAVPGLVVEDWSSYADDAALQSAFTTNKGWANNEIKLTRLPAGASPLGPAGVAVAYEIQAAAPNDYVGFERDLAVPQDWSGYKELALAVQTTDRSDRQLVIQFQEPSGEVWRHRLKLRDVPLDGLVTVPLDPSAWEWADWSTPGNKQLDLGQINHVGVFIGHTGPGAGEVRLGTVALRR